MTEKSSTACFKPGVAMVVRPRVGAWCSWAGDVISGETRCGYPEKENHIHFVHGHGADYHLSGVSEIVMNLICCFIFRSVARTIHLSSEVVRAKVSEELKKLLIIIR